MSRRTCFARAVFFCWRSSRRWMESLPSDKDKRPVCDQLLLPPMPDSSRTYLSWTLTRCACQGGMLRGSRRRWKGGGDVVCC